jgi:flagellin
LTGDLTSTADAAASVFAITAAINTVSETRGTIPASVNQLVADMGVQSSEVTNLTSAQNSIQSADIGKTVASMTQYNVLQQTGMSALSQSTQAMQALLKLLQ